MSSNGSARDLPGGQLVVSHRAIVCIGKAERRMSLAAPKSEITYLSEHPAQLC